MNEEPANSAPGDELDRALSELATRAPRAPTHLAPRIVANLPAREPATALLSWLQASTWRVLSAAALPLLVGFLIGISAAEPAPADFAASSILFAEHWEGYVTDEL